MKDQWEDMKSIEELDYWMVFWSDNRGYEVHCGYCLEFHIEDGWHLIK